MHDAARRVLLLPGWQNSGPAHWQSRWERLHGYQRVEQADWRWPRRGDWMARLEEAVLARPEPALLVAHSLGCHLVAAWAAHSGHVRRVAGALLVAPPDFDRADMPPQLHNWRPMMRQRLPFPAIAVLSADDPYCALGSAEALARDWAAQIVMAEELVAPRPTGSPADPTLAGQPPALGHLNAESGLGDWHEGHALLRALDTGEPSSTDTP